MTVQKTEYAVLWTRTSTDGKTKRVDFKIYKTRAAAQKAMSYWLSERTAGKFASFQNQIEPALLERPAPSRWIKTDWKPE